MKYIVIITIIIPSLYLFSYAKYVWKNSKRASIGAVIMALASIGLPVSVILFR
ncbi:MAG: hypothetical protein N3I35_09305 [Clostridia bacterium]|nr:hypothetical protein [Clostridia bacterium]